MASWAQDRLVPPYVLLEDRLTNGAGGLLYAQPHNIIRCDEISDVAEAFNALEKGLAQGFHAAGVISYELGYALEPRLADLIPEGRDAPLVLLGLFDPPEFISAELLDLEFGSLAPPPPISDLRAGTSQVFHAEKVREILRLIEAGDVYQVNLTFPFHFNFSGSPLSLYAALRSRQPVAHGGIAALEDVAVLSVSPELWVEVDNGYATMRPMKGTSARATSRSADELARDRLVSDPKQRAENLMIVDLLRNDLARVSIPGTVSVPKLFSVETYPTFHALTSTVTARIEPNTSLLQQMEALFPCGSVVGAPKIRAGEIIRSLEELPRGFYTGTLGAVTPNGDMSFNVAIRTAILRQDGIGRYQVGGGIVADSDPDAEYEEALTKARVLTDLANDFALIETFRWTCSEGFVRLELHLKRMTHSASQLGFVFEAGKLHRSLKRLSAKWAQGKADQRMRVELSRVGKIKITHGDVPAAKRVLHVCLADTRLDPGDPFLRHKTTKRALHELAFKEATASGFDEVVFLNRRGEVAEASRNSVFLQIGERLVTPPVSAGLLPSVLRQELISTGQAIERTVSIDDLRSNPLAIGNSLHGLRSATLFGSLHAPDPG